MEPDSLDPDELVQFAFLFSMPTTQSDNVIAEYHLGIVDREIMESVTSPLLQMLRTPGGRNFWKAHSGAHRPDFREYVAKQLHEAAV